MSDAEICLRQCAELAPRYAEAQVNLGLVLVQTGRNAEAAAQADIARRFGGEPLPNRMPAIFVNRLYARRALEWDRLMTQGNYRGAHLVAQVLTRFAPQDKQLEILDAGCGTGLVAKLLRDRAASLVGVDLSGEMLARAATKSAYSSLHQGDLIEFLATRPQSYDAVTCAATLIHFGDLQPVFGAARNALRAGGLFVFTLLDNKTDTSGYAAGTLADGYAQGGSYAHGVGYVDSAARSAGFEVLLLQEAVQEAPGPRRSCCS